MLLSHVELMALVARGVIRNVDLDYVNAASVDITLGKKVLIECGDLSDYHTISLRNRDPLRTLELDCTNGVVLKPGQFILCQSQQEFNLPDDISAEYKLKSSMARIGLNHALAGFCDAGWNKSVLTLELMNHNRFHPIEIMAGDRIGQMLFFHHTKVPADKSYAARGRYNGDREVSGVKP